MRSNEREFHLKEYDSVRAEVSTLLARIETLFKYSIVASATVFAWLMANTFGTTNGGSLCIRAPAQILSYAWGIPAGFVYFAAAIAGFNYFRVRHLGTYLLKVENALGTSSLGWQKFDKGGTPWLTISTIVVWALMVSAATYAGYLGRAAIQGTQGSKKSAVLAPLVAGATAALASGPSASGAASSASSGSSVPINIGALNRTAADTEQLCPKT